MCRIGPDIHVLDVYVPQKEGAVWGIFRHLHPIGLSGQNDAFFAQKCIRLVYEKLTVFPYRHDIIGICVSLAF